MTPALSILLLIAAVLLAVPLFAISGSVMRKQNRDTERADKAVILNLDATEPTGPDGAVGGRD
jgi:hypothetical protein